MAPSPGSIPPKLCIPLPLPPFHCPLCSPDLKEIPCSPAAHDPSTCSQALRDPSSSGIRNTSVVGPLTQRPTPGFHFQMRLGDGWQQGDRTGRGREGMVGRGGREDDGPRGRRERCTTERSGGGRSRGAERSWLRQSMENCTIMCWWAAPALEPRTRAVVGGGSGPACQKTCHLSAHYARGALHGIF